MYARTLKILSVEPHPNADNLEVLMIDGAQVVNTKGQYRKNDVVIFIPAGVIIPHWFAEEFTAEVEFTAISKGENQEYTIKARNIIGEPSDGIIVQNKGNFPEGYIVEIYYGFSSEGSNVCPIYYGPIEKTMEIISNNSKPSKITIPTSQNEWLEVFIELDSNSSIIVVFPWLDHSSDYICRRDYVINIEKDSFGSGKIYSMLACDDESPSTLAISSHLNPFIDFIMGLQKGTVDSRKYF